MLEAAGLALAAFTTLKEVYLLSRFILRTILSASHHLEERDQLFLKFRHEYLYLASFRFLFLQNDGLVADNGLDRAWLIHVGQLLDQVRKIHDDYAKIAAIEDAEYRQFSPFLNASAANSRMLEFSMEESPAPDDARRTFQTVSWLSNLGHKVSDMDWRWALFKKRRLERVLTRYQEWNGRLKEFVPITVRVHVVRTRRQDLPLPVSSLASDEDVFRLGILPHARLRELHEAPPSDSTAFQLSECLVERVGTQNSPINLAALTSKEPETKFQADADWQYLVEFKYYEHYPDTQIDQQQTRGQVTVRGQVRQLASLLHSSYDTDLRTLRLKGCIDQNPELRYAFVFEFPTWASKTPPTSLYEIIASPSAFHDIGFHLQRRFYVAQCLAKSLWTLHSDSWVHKSIRSACLVFFRNQTDNQLNYSLSYLVDFEYSRPASALTSLTYDDDADKNLYRHPDRQGVPEASKKRAFTKLHDIYALGVVLLEIGVWRTAAVIRDEAEAGNKKIFGRDLQALYLMTARRQLPRTMGTAYLEATVACLMGEFMSPEDAGFGMEFLEKVVEKVDVAKLHG